MNEINGAGYNPAVEDVPRDFGYEEVEEEHETEQEEGQTVVIEFSEEEVAQLSVGDRIDYTFLLDDGKRINLIFRQL